MTELKVSLRQAAHTWPSIDPTNPWTLRLGNQIDEWADGYIKELEELTLVCPRHKIDKYASMTEKWAFTQGYELCRQEILSLLRGSSSKRILNAAT
jgi:hypothetical protein